MQKSKKVRMPAGIRNKLMAAVAMLLVSSIMMVSSTYAWFTLSTAPEVTGITTSVGANGNLEIALLTTETYEGTATIGSAVGDSSAASGKVTESNITWGNLIDLSDISYGLNLIALNPAALSHPMQENGQDQDTTKVLTSNLLQTAEYGSDGRVSKLNANTVSGIYDSNNSKWIVEKDISTTTVPNKVQTRGVRAIGVDSNMSTAQIVLNAAKAAVSSGVNGGASSGVSTAVNNNQITFLALAMSASDTYGQADVDALKAVAIGVQTSLNTIVKTYSNAVLAELAAMETDADKGTTALSEEQLTLLRSQLSNNTSASTLISLMNTANVTSNSYTTRLNELVNAQAEVKGVIAACDGYVSGTTDVENSIIIPLIDGVVTYNADGGTVADMKNNVGSIKSIYITDGLVATVAEDTGTYLMTTAQNIPLYAGTKDGTTGYLAAVATNVSELNIKDDTNAESTIADFYGYIIDFAFRTNAAGSSLQLQTTAANRVYSNAEGENLATQGAGSTVTFAFDASMSAEQVTGLLEAVNLVFLNPADGTIYKTAGLSNIKVDLTTYIATAEVKLTGLAADADPDNIIELQQNVATKVSVLVYLDGDKVDNTDVGNVASSGMLNLNLQFSSSTTLIPMENTALKNMVITYTELSDNDYAAGLYTFGGALYTVNSGYKIYNGSDGMVYFGKVATDATEPDSYTKLTVVNAATALTAVTVTVASETSNIVAVNKSITLKATVAGVDAAEITGIAWESTAPGTAAVAGASTTPATSATVTGVATGNADIKATVTFTFDYTDSNGAAQKMTKTATVIYPVTVTTAEQVYHSVTVPTGVSGSTTAADGVAYTFTVANGYTLGTVTVGGTEVTPTNNGSGSYTIPADDVKGNIVIGVNAVTYTVYLSDSIANATVSVGSTTAYSQGATVTLTVTADEGYTVSSVTCTSRSGNTEYDVTAGDNGTYTFPMPAEDVEITVTAVAS